MSGLKMKPVEALVRAIRSIAAHNTSVALAYAVNRGPFASLTEAQRKQVHGAACSLLGLALTATPEEMQVAVATAEREGRKPRFVWVHQRYNPFSNPGEKRRPALFVQYDGAVAKGWVTPAQDFVTACKAAVESGTIEQQPRRGGFILAVKADADAQRAERKAQKPTKGSKLEAAELADLF